MACPYNAGDSPRDRASVPPDVRFPDAQHGPSHFPQFTSADAVTGAIGRDLGGPVRGIRASGKLFPKDRPVASMPEISVAEHHKTCRTEDEVWPARKQLMMRSIAKLISAERFAKKQFRFGVDASIGPLRSRTCLRGRAKSGEGRCAPSAGQLQCRRISSAGPSVASALGRPRRPPASRNARGKRRRYSEPTSDSRRSLEDQCRPRGRRTRGDPRRTARYLRRFSSSGSYHGEDRTKGRDARRPLLRSHLTDATDLQQLPKFRISASAEHAH